MRRCFIKLLAWKVNADYVLRHKSHLDTKFAHLQIKTMCLKWCPTNDLFDITYDYFLGSFQISAKHNRRKAADLFSTIFAQKAFYQKNLSCANI